MWHSTEWFSAAIRHPWSVSRSGSRLGAAMIVVAALAWPALPAAAADDQGNECVSPLPGPTGAAAESAGGVSPCCVQLQFDCWDFGATCLDNDQGSCYCAIDCDGDESTFECIVPGNTCIDGICVSFCGFEVCLPWFFCCGFTHCCPADGWGCINSTCVQLCTPNETSCGSNCCAPGLSCVGGECKQACGTGYCEPDIEICCGDNCCSAADEACDPLTQYLTCAPKPVCGPGETYVEYLNICCNSPGTCNTPAGARCCDPFTQYCGLVTQTDFQCVPNDGVLAPGEVSGTVPMLVTGYDEVTGDVTVSYDPACGATDNAVEWGPLSEVAHYVYWGQVCGLGNSGSATFNVPADTFFLVVGRHETKEGLYGNGWGGGQSFWRGKDWGQVQLEGVCDLAPTACVNNGIDCQIANSTGYCGADGFCEPLPCYGDADCYGGASCSALPANAFPCLLPQDPFESCD